MKTVLASLAVLACVLSSFASAGECLDDGFFPKLTIMRVSDAGTAEVCRFVGVVDAIGEGDRYRVVSPMTLKEDWVTYKIPIDGVVAETIGGEAVSPAKVAERLRVPTAVLVVSDECNMSPTLRECFEEDTLVFRVRMPEVSYKSLGVFELLMSEELPEK